MQNGILIKILDWKNGDAEYTDKRGKSRKGKIKVSAKIRVLSCIPRFYYIPKKILNHYSLIEIRYSDYNIKCNGTSIEEHRLTILDWKKIGTRTTRINAENHGKGR